MKYECTKLNLYGVMVLYAPELCRDEGITVAATDGDRIFVTDSFFTFSEDVQKFILYHELGHQALGHTEFGFFKSMLVYLEKRLKGYSKRELEADAWAINKLGGRLAEKALLETREYIYRKYGRNIDLTELNKRIEQARNLY